MSYFITALKRYSEFTGRSRRAEYWYFYLISTVISIALSFGISFTVGETASLIVGGTYSLALLIPTLAVTVRRLHDVGKSGWWMFISIIPLIGGIWLIVLLVRDSNPESNIYGPNPKIVA